MIYFSVTPLLLDGGIIIENNRTKHNFVNRELSIEKIIWHLKWFQEIGGHFEHTLWFMNFIWYSKLCYMFSNWITWLFYDEWWILSDHRLFLMFFSYSNDKPEKNKFINFALKINFSRLSRELLILKLWIVLRA